MFASWKRLFMLFPRQVINQVSDFFVENATSDSSGFAASQARLSSACWKHPALGLAWAQCINTRIFFTRTCPHAGNKSHIVGTLAVAVCGSKLSRG
jgi:hypothetical protein